MRTGADVTIIDYKRGNLYSIEKAVRQVGGTPRLTSDPVEISKANKLILPGVGAFGDAMFELRRSDIAEAIAESVAKGNHLLGICLGMQLLFPESHEFGLHHGLDLIGGKVVRFKKTQPDELKFKVPHIAWCSINSRDSNNNYKTATDTKWKQTILQGIDSGTNFYFVHSYICVPDSPEVVLAESIYGHDRFCSVVRSNNIWGCQFHPEKSGVNGLKIYENFIHIID